MNVAVIGSGGREHAICFQLQRSKEIKKLFCIPGNAGTKTICENIDIDYLNFDLLYSFLQQSCLIIIIWYGQILNYDQLSRSKHKCAIKNYF